MQTLCLMVEIEEGYQPEWPQKPESDQPKDVTEKAMFIGSGPGLLVGEILPDLEFTLDGLMHGAKDVTPRDFGLSSVILEAGDDENPTIYRIDSNGTISKCFREGDTWQTEMGFSTYYPPLNENEALHEARLISSNGKSVSIPTTPRVTNFQTLLALVTAGGTRPETELNIGPVKKVAIVSENQKVDRVTDPSYNYQAPKGAPKWFYQPRTMHPPSERASAPLARAA